MHLLAEKLGRQLAEVQDPHICAGIYLRNQ